MSAKEKIVKAESAMNAAVQYFLENGFKSDWRDKRREFYNEAEIIGFARSGASLKFVFVPQRNWYNVYVYNEIQ